MFNYLKPNTFYDGKSSEPTWQNNIVKKHFDIPLFEGALYQNHCVALLSINGRKIVTSTGPTEVFACCGLRQLQGYGINPNFPRTDNKGNLVGPPFNLVPFWEEYWPAFREHQELPCLAIIAEYSGGTGFIYPELDKILVENSERLCSLRNVRYENHLLHLQCFYPKELTEQWRDILTSALALKNSAAQFDPN